MFSLNLIGVKQNYAEEL